MCGTLMDNPERFKIHFLQSFVVLGTDKVPNVRILVAKALYEKYTVGSILFTLIVIKLSMLGPLFDNEEILALVKVMKSDKSRDVQSWISKIDLENVKIVAKLLNTLLTESTMAEESKVLETSMDAVNVTQNSEAALLGNNETTENSMIEEPSIVIETEHNEKEESTDKTNSTNAEQNETEAPAPTSVQENNAEGAANSDSLETHQVKDEQKMDLEQEGQLQEKANDNEVGVSKGAENIDGLESNGEVKNETVATN